jgi:hypothetical protein
MGYTTPICQLSLSLLGFNYTAVPGQSYLMAYSKLINMVGRRIQLGQDLFFVSNCLTAASSLCNVGTPAPCLSQIIHRSWWLCSRSCPSFLSKRLSTISKRELTGSWAGNHRAWLQNGKSSQASIHFPVSISQGQAETSLEMCPKTSDGCLLPFHLRGKTPTVC